MEKSHELSNNPSNPEKMALKIEEVKNFPELQNIRLVGDSEDVEVGDCMQIKKNSKITTYSWGANPCVSGIVQTIDDKLYMFHSVGSVLSFDQEKLLKIAKKGVVGGGPKTLSRYFDKFKSANLQIIYPPEPEHDFNIVFVKDKNEANTAPGLYYCYDEPKPPHLYNAIDEG